MFLADTLITQIEQGMKDTRMRQEIVDGLIDLAERGRDDKPTISHFFDKIRAFSDDLSDSDCGQLQKAHVIMKSVFDSQPDDYWAS